jgi:hypothetical protein
MIEIGSSGLNPSNRGAGFPNLARQQNPTDAMIAEVTERCEAELQAAGIDVVKIGFLLKGEVPSKAFGSLHGWDFDRAWYYWRAKGPGIPLEAAERLHATHGQQVRVDGHCGCPSPREWFHGFGCGSYHVDSPEGLKALADTIRSVYIAPESAAVHEGT